LASSLQFCFDFAAQVTGTDLRALYERQGYNFSFPRPTRNDPEPIVDDWLTGEWRNSLEKRQLRLADDLFFPAKTSVKGGTAFLASKPT
jgi:hypothetical protein